MLVYEDKSFGSDVQIRLHSRPISSLARSVSHSVCARFFCLSVEFWITFNDTHSYSIEFFVVVVAFVIRLVCLFASVVRREITLGRVLCVRVYERELYLYICRRNNSHLVFELKIKKNEIKLERTYYSEILKSLPDISSTLRPHRRSALIRCCRFSILIFSNRDKRRSGCRRIDYSETRVIVGEWEILDRQTERSMAAAAAAAATSVVVLDRGNNTTCTINLHGKSCVCSEHQQQPSDYGKRYVTNLWTFNLSQVASNK